MNRTPSSLYKKYIWKVGQSDRLCGFIRYSLLTGILTNWKLLQHFSHNNLFFFPRYFYKSRFLIKAIRALEIKIISLVRKFSISFNSHISICFRIVANSINKSWCYSVADLQEFLGFEAPQAIYKWQSGKSLPSTDNLFALSHFFEVSIEEILVAEKPKFQIVSQEESCDSDFLVPFLQRHIAW